MGDQFSKEKRSSIMASIRSTDTGPERAMRHALRELGIRYRLYRKIGGITVDAALPDCRVAIFVDGCFWHGCPAHFSPPSTRRSYWMRKIVRNMERDAQETEVVIDSGWAVVRIWEHQLRGGGGAVRRCLLQVLTGVQRHRGNDGPQAAR